MSKLLTKERLEQIHRVLADCLTNRITSKNLAMVLSRSHYHKTYITKHKKDEDEYVREHWRTFHKAAKDICSYLKSCE